MTLSRQGFVGLLPPLLQRPALRLVTSLSTLPESSTEAWLKDLWPGDAERGKQIIERRFMLAGCDITFARQTGWYAKEATLPWLRALHGFQWMRDVAACQDGKSGRGRLRRFVEDWLEAGNSLHPAANEPAVMGERLSQWITYTASICHGSQPVFRRRFLRAMQAQMWRLRRLLAKERAPHLSAIKGLLLAALVLPGNAFLHTEARAYLDDFLVELRHLDALPTGRNPVYLHASLRSLMEIQAAYVHATGAADEALQGAINELAGLVRGLLHGDGGFVLFNGATEGQAEEIAHTFAHPMLTPLEMDDETFRLRSGYARLEAGDTRVVMDVVAPNPQETDSFFGTLAFEWGSAARRFVVNCGAFIGEDSA